MFVHLHNHSDFSLLDGACRIPELIEIVTAQSAPAVALTDHGNMFGALEFYTQARKADIKPIVGCEFYMASGSRKEKKNRAAGGQRYHQVLLAKDYTGYQNLCKLTSESFISGFYYKPRIDKELLTKYSEGLICLSSCLQGEIPQLILDGNIDLAKKVADFYKNLFGDDFYLEIQRHGIDKQEQIIPPLAQFAEDLGLKLVATNDSHFLKREDATAHDVLLCVGTQSKVSDENRMRFDGEEFYVKSAEEMTELFHDFPEAISNTLEIAEKVNLEIDLETRHYPVYTSDDHADINAEEYLEQLTREGYKKRYGDNPPAECEERLATELKVIFQTGFANYFLVVWDFVRWAKGQDILVGPGRGSAAGCMVSYCLGITNLDPIKYGLLFERFLNPERVSPPDIDIDFSDDRREEVISYVREKYGEDSVCRITTFGKMASKSAVRDAARAMSISYADADEIAKLIPEGPKVTLKKSLDEVPELDKLINSDPRKRELMDIALKLEGTVRHSGTHAAGVVICPGRTHDFIPVHKMGGEGEEYTQFDMNWVDKLGLLKMDFLGLQTLGELDRTVKSLAKHGIEVDLDTLDLEDEDVYKLIGEGKTVGVFQFESSGMRDNLRKLKPNRIEDLLAMNALYRPGPMDNIPSYIACRHGKEEPKYIHSSLEPILAETYGVVTYQEQVMRIATDLAGFSLGKADVLRWAMGKKKLHLMEGLKQEFLDGCVEGGIKLKAAKSIYGLCEKFANYGFVKAHAAGYAIIAYQCAFMKTHHLADYLAACLTVRRRNPDMVLKLLSECRNNAVTILPPDANDSEHGFVSTENGIRFGLSAIKNVGDAAVKSIIEAQTEHGPFDTFHQFLNAVDLRTVNKKVIESMIDAGAFNSLGENRGTLLASLPGAMAYANAMQDERDRGQGTLFGGVGVDPSVHIPPPNFHYQKEYPTSEKQEREKAVLGFYISSHPLDSYTREINSFSTIDLTERDELTNGQKVKLCGILCSVKIRTSKAGNIWAEARLEDRKGSIVVKFIQASFKQAKSLLENDKLLAISGKIQKNDDALEAEIMVDNTIPLESASSRWGNRVHLNINKDWINEARLNKLNTIFSLFPGNCPVYIDLVNGAEKPTTFRIGATVKPDSKLLDNLSEFVGKNHVRLG